MINLVRAVLLSALALSIASGEALAHTPDGLAGSGFVAGFVHPFGGLDHLLATVAAGAWIARLGRRASVIVPLAILAALGLGLIAGLGGIPVPAEAGITASLLILAVALLFDLRPLPIVAAVAAGFFAFFHGHAHGTEIPEFVNSLACAAGLGAASVLLMVLGGVAAGFQALDGRCKRISHYR